MVKTNGIFGVKCPKSLRLGGSIILPSYKKDGIGVRRSIIPQLIKWIILLDMYQARKMSGHGYVLGVSLFPLPTMCLLGDGTVLRVWDIFVFQIIISICFRSSAGQRTA